MFQARSFYGVNHIVMALFLYVHGYCEIGTVRKNKIELNLEN